MIVLPFYIIIVKQVLKLVSRGQTLDGSLATRDYIETVVIKFYHHQ